MGRLIALPECHPNPKSGALIGEFRLALRSKDDPDMIEFVKVGRFDNPQRERFVAGKPRESVDAGVVATGTGLTVVGWEHPPVRRGRRVGTHSTRSRSSRLPGETGAGPTTPAPQKLRAAGLARRRAAGLSPGSTMFKG